MKILVVDDDVVARTQLAAAVQKAGHVALRASDGQRAWQVLEDNPDIGMLVCDLGMPVLGGDGLLRMVRASRELQRLPFIMVTIGGSEGESARLQQAGATELVEKPIDMALVAAAIEAASRRAAARTPERPGVRSCEDPASMPVFDRADLLERMANDEGIARDVVASFLADAERGWTELERAIGAHDAARAVALLHRFKGALANVGAPRAACAAAASEAALKAGQPATAQLRALQTALAELQRALRAA